MVEPVSSCTAFVQTCTSLMYVLVHCMIIKVLQNIHGGTLAWYNFRLYSEVIGDGNPFLLRKVDRAYIGYKCALTEQAI